MCDSFLRSAVPGGAFIHVALGNLVDDPTIRPSKHLFVDPEAPWFTITDDPPRFEEHGVVAGLAGG